MFSQHRISAFSTTFENPPEMEMWKPNRIAQILSIGEPDHYNEDMQIHGFLSTEE
jgi:hypothetical protein